MSDALLELKNLSVEYKSDFETVFAINKASLSLNTGETLGIVGETGAGKTTMALTILKLLPERVSIVREGSVIFKGKNLLSLTEHEMMEIRGEQISMIFQDPMTSLNPVHTIGDQILEALKLHNKQNKNREELDSRVDEVLEMVGIPPSRKKDYPHQFSGGMKQRVVIAIALACEPYLLIADEPTTALDVTIQAQVLLLMRELKSRLKTAMILITHDLGVVAQMCDRVAVMYAGEIVETGTLEEIFTGNKHHPYTQGLFSSIPKPTDPSKSLLHPIEGMMPDPTNLPEGCYFRPRCPHAGELCFVKQAERMITPSHMIRCVRMAKEV